MGRNYFYIKAISGPTFFSRLNNYLKNPEIKKIRESFDSYEEVTTDEDKYARRIIDH